MFFCMTVVMPAWCLAIEGYFFIPVRDFLLTISLGVKAEAPERPSARPAPPIPAFLEILDGPFSFKNFRLCLSYYLFSTKKFAHL